MFIPNYKKTAIINSAHIIRVDIDPPYLEQRDYMVVAKLTYGEAILCRGTEAECEMYICGLSKML